MEDIESRLKGHRLTKMNYFEHQNIHDLDIIKAIVQNRIGSAKKISNTRFQEIFSQYDAFIQDLISRAKNSDEDMVFYSIALFTLEWHYPIELFYYISCMMEEADIQEINRSNLILLCGNVTIESLYSGRVSTQSRMVKERLLFAELLFSQETPLLVKEELVSMVKEIIALADQFQYKESRYCNDEMKYIDWFRTESTVADWASFFRYYDIFSIWEKKEWTLKRIRNMRSLFQLTTQEKI